MDEFLDFTNKFFRLTGIDLQLYKRPQMERRITTFRNKLGFYSYSEFIEKIQNNSQLMQQLLDRMTINVSEFFRNMDRWQSLLPHLRNLTNGQAISAWSAACSTGEEPYTLAMFIEKELKIPYKILATDIDVTVLNQAKKGIYRSHQIREIPDEYLKTYFTQENHLWTIHPNLKTHITFKQHNLLADCYPHALDLIICRNVLIYFTEDAKLKIIQEFARALRTGGLLFVGSTEQLIQAETNGFTPVVPFLYRKMKP